MKPMVRARSMGMRLTRDTPGQRLGFMTFSLALRGRIARKPAQTRDKSVGYRRSRAGQGGSRIEPQGAKHYTRPFPHPDEEFQPSMINPSALAPYANYTLSEAVIPELPGCYRGKVR